MVQTEWLELSDGVCKTAVHNGRIVQFQVLPTKDGDRFLARVRERPLVVGEDESTPDAAIGVFDDEGAARAVCESLVAEVTMGGDFE